MNYCEAEYDSSDLIANLFFRPRERVERTRKCQLHLMQFIIIDDAFRNALKKPLETLFGECKFFIFIAHLSAIEKALFIALSSSSRGNKVC